MNATKTIEQVTITLKKNGRRKAEVYVVPASRVDGMMIWHSIAGDVAVASVDYAPSKEVFVPSVADLARISEPSCDAQFDETTGQLRFSAR